jgi:SAM-dependent methyltransferase
MGVPERWPGLRLIAVSFVALFLELMLIRWVPSQVRLVAYYANLILISSFLGLGLGAMGSGRGARQLPRFGFLLAGFVVLMSVLHSTTLPGSDTEIRFFAGQGRLANYLALLVVFVANGWLFVPLGDEIGRLFKILPALRGYSCDLLGSLLGTVFFGIFALRFFSPTAGMLLTVALVFLMSWPGGDRRLRRAQLVTAGGGVLAALAVLLLSRSPGLWSPYYFITIEPFGEPAERAVALREPPPALRTMTDPPIYMLHVNQDTYQFQGSIDVRRYTPGSDRWEYVDWLRQQYLLPYTIASRTERVLVVGAGGGLDVEGALLSGAAQVEAVEVDPIIIALAGRFNAADVYEKPNVTVRNDDARAFLQRATGPYDVIAFGFLDSQALFSSMANIRLDGFVYTVESLARAYELLSADGVLVLSFGTGEGTFLASKLARMLTAATGKPPLVYHDANRRIFITPRGAHREPPPEFGPFTLLPLVPDDVAVATDDWPYLYLSGRTIPRDYLIVITALLAVSFIGVALVKPPAMGWEGVHFLLLGFGFLLLETSSIVRCSLYFGATWLVTMIVVAGVLLMVLAANLAVLRFRPRGEHWYVWLLASVVLVYVTPGEVILGLSFPLRLAWTLVAVPLPIFFAGIVFSSSFARATNSAAMLGANLVGAMLGGFSEYLGMAVGHDALLLVVMVAYVSSWMCRRLAWQPMVS